MNAPVPARRVGSLASGIVVAVAAIVSPLIAGAILSACQPCHAVEAKAIALDCLPSSTFVGELHFTDAAAFRSFLTDRCLGVADATAVDAIVDAVDFGADAVVVARGARAGSARCIEQRSVDGAAVCEDGVHVAFADVVTNVQPCPGDWTIAFSLPRAELRAAIADDLVADGVDL